MGEELIFYIFSQTAYSASRVISIGMQPVEKHAHQPKEKLIYSDEKALSDFTYKGTDVKVKLRC